MSIHRGIDADDRAGYHGAVFELDGDLFSVEFLEKFDELHSSVFGGVIVLEYCVGRMNLLDDGWGWLGLLRLVEVIGRRLQLGCRLLLTI